MSSEEYFHYDTGDALDALQYGFDVSLTQGQTITGEQLLSDGDRPAAGGS